jgi:hypothetical protein
MLMGIQCQPAGHLTELSEAPQTIIGILLDADRHPGHVAREWQVQAAASELVIECEEELEHQLRAQRKRQALEGGDAQGRTVAAWPCHPSGG